MTTKILDAMEVLTPTDELLRCFNQIAVTNYERIRVLNRQNEKLIEARDRLLPKLMSGEIEV